jgi:hypothetical protein
VSDEAEAAQDRARLRAKIEAEIDRIIAAAEQLEEAAAKLRADLATQRQELKEWDKLFLMGDEL